MIEHKCPICNGSFMAPKDVICACSLPCWEMLKRRYKLTVVLRNDGPIRYCNGVPSFRAVSFRSVTIELTPEQCVAIAPRKTDSVAGTDYFEAISQSIVEAL